MKKILFLFFIVLLSFSSQASHYIGGEITWECDKDLLSPNYGKYTFYMTIYQDCDGIDFSTTGYDIDVHNHPSLFSINLPFVSSVDISPTGVPGSTPCYDCNTQPFGTFGAVKQWNYASAPTTITGSPSADGWHFTWGTCCRSGNITNIGTPGSMDWIVRSVMYPYTDPSGTIFPNSNECYENSPIFKEEPKTILCSGYPFSYSHLAFDVELDSLSYSWAEPLDVASLYNYTNPSSQAIPYIGGYTVTSPIPGNPTLDSENGEISFFSMTNGVFVTVIKVAAFKCGQLVAEVYRDVNVALLGCGTLPNGAQNSPPLITAPVGSQNWITTLNPSTGLPSYETTIMAGELVNFSVVATDSDINSTGNMQDLSLEVEGGQLDPLLALSNPASFIVTSSSPGNISGDFEWLSNCDHMQDYGCGRQGGAYTFNIKSYDDFCPANGIKMATITINVIPPQPDLRCLAVDANGGVDLYFSFPAGVIDTNIKYDIYHSKQISGPYSLLDSIFYPDTTFYHSGSDANTSQSYYYLLGSVTCGTNIGGGSDSLLYSDTLSTILMHSTAVNMGVTADLNWNPTHNPLIPSSSTDYDVHYINADNFDAILSVQTDTFAQMDGDRCDYIPQFYVEIPDISGCVSKSSISSVNLLDTLSPVTPIIEDISVDVNGKSVVSWSVSADSDFYIVYIQDNNGAWITLDTVLFGTNSYQFVNSNATINSENFTVRALDSCGNTRVRSEIHNSIYLVQLVDECDHSVQLNWNDYINWSGGTHHFNVFINEIDENGVVISDVITVTNSTEYLLDGLTSSSQYEIYVEAYNFDASFVAVSNLLDFNISLAAKPKFHYIEYVTVNPDNGFIELNCYVDNQGVIDHYDIYRSKIVNGVEVGLDLIDNVTFNGTSSVHYIDNEASTSNYSYLYKTYPVDTCGITLNVPPVDDPAYVNDISYAQSILLEVEVNKDYSNFPGLESDYTNTITFNEYDKWLGDVSKYELFRSINNEPFVMLPIKTWDMDNNSNQELVFIDKVTEFGETNGKFCYYIKATEGNNTPYGSVPEGSLSNIVCISQTPNIFVPNTFTPNGDEHNEVFRPIAYFVSEVGYSFSIFNRNGSEIFSNNEPSKGWDGTYKGRNVQNDNYVYHLQYINSDGELTNKTDAFTLVR